MRIIILLLLCCFGTLLKAQCPDRDFLWKRIIYFTDSDRISTDQQLPELLNYLVEINRCPYKNDSTHALLLHRIGVLYSLKGDYYNSIKYYKQAITVINTGKNNPAINPKRIVKSYYNLSLQYEALRLSGKRAEIIDSCIAKAMFYKTGYEYAADCLKIKTNDYLDNGDYYRCIDFADISYKFIKDGTEKIDFLDATLFEFFTTKINALLAIGKVAKAKELLIGTIEDAITTNKKNQFGTIYGLYGTVLRMEKKYDSSVACYQKSFKYHKKIKYLKGCAEALNNLGFVNSNWLNAIIKAISNYKQALEYADADESLNTNTNIANLYVKIHQFDSAFFYFQRAFAELKPGSDEKYLLQKNLQDYTAKTTEYQTSLVLDKADGRMQQYFFTRNKQYLTDAVKVLKTADLFFDKIKTQQTEIQSKLFWKTNNRRLYEHALEACLLLDNKEDAFYFFEKSRSVLLGDQVNEQRGLSDDELTRQAQLKKSIATLERSVNDSISGGNIETLKQELFIQKQQLEKINGSHNNANGFFTNAELPSISRIQQQVLTGNKTLVELFYGDSAVYMIALTQSSSCFTKFNKTLYDSLTASYISFIANSELLNKNFTGFTTVSNALYELIFKNIQLPANGSIIISPDGKSFPFEALVTSRNYAVPAYLLMNHATCYTYSARYLLGAENKNKNDLASLLGLAPVAFKSKANLTLLTGSDISLQRISTYFTTATSIVFDSATSNNFSKQFANYSILQLYAHAAENSNGSDPVIYFADKPFYLSDLVAERQPLTRLVVLSACETAKGKFYGGEGVFSFNRGFAALGIPAAISNLWSPDNESTYKLTELFYKFLSKGMPTDVALQQAKIEFINSASLEEKRLPYYWASAILTGKAEVFKTQYNYHYLWWLGVVAAVIILIVVARKTKLITFEK